MKFNEFGLRKTIFSCFLAAAVLVPGDSSADSDLRVEAQRMTARSKVGAGELRRAIVTGTSVDELHVRGLRQFAGRKLQVFYVNGREPSIGMDGQSLTVRAVKMLPQEVRIDSHGEAVVPATLVPRGSFHVFNYVVFVVPTVENHSLFMRNSDGTRPIDPRVNSLTSTEGGELEFGYDYMKFISVLDLREIKKASSSLSFIELDAARDF